MNEEFLTSKEALNSRREIIISSEKLRGIREKIRVIYQSLPYSERVSFFKKMNEFASFLLSNFERKELKKNPLFHLIIGSTLSEEEENNMIKAGYLIDYPGEFSIVSFLEKLINDFEIRK